MCVVIILVEYTRTKIHGGYKWTDSEWEEEREREQNDEKREKKCANVL